jgi:low affinity Fe/Cu permease
MKECDATSSPLPPCPPSPPKRTEWFRCFARKIAEFVGSPSAFLFAIGLILLWGATGPVFHYSDTWQLVINTGTTIITFLMVFLIQNTQNRDAKAIHLKLDELIHAVKGARNSLVNLENLSDEQLEKLQDEFQRVAKTYQRANAMLQEGDEAAKRPNAVKK